MQDLVNELFILEGEVKERAGRIAFLKDQLKENLEHGETVTASNGYQWKLSKTTKNNYDDAAVSYVADVSVEALKLFASISDTGLTKAKKAGFISAMDVAVLEGMAHQTETVSGRWIAPSIDTVLPEKVGV